MASLFPFLILLIVFAAMATLYTEGMWSNAVRLINVVTAALLAMNFFEPLARWFDDMMPSYTYFCDFLALWLLFGGIVMILRAATDQVSKVQVRFVKIVDRIGSSFFALWVGWVLVCFTMTTLHTAPLAKNFMFGGFKPEEKMIFGMGPDRQWLGFTQKVSEGAFCRSATPEEWQRKKFVFDPNADFMPKYNERRAACEKSVGATGAARTN
jgi:uncharacterized membrane protein required for colicin V production